jgi:hypothetical protein
VTEDIIKASAVLGIGMHDHLVIGRSGHTSLRDLGLIPSEVGGIEENLSAPSSPEHSRLRDETAKD